MTGFDLGIFAERLGWSLVGVCAPEISAESKNRTEIWLKDFKGPQMNYLVKRSEERLDPKKYFPEVNSILSFGLYYFQGWAKGKVKVSNYAWGKDYHSVLNERLEKTVGALEQELGSFKYKIAVDTAPVLEKTIAEQAGLGWQGKNTLILNPKFGSLFFLGEIFTSLPLSTFQAKLPVQDHCGKCQKCIEACPTRALTPYVLDASKCISYWTLEHKGAFTASTPEYSEWIAGCDICQEVCPWNQKLIPLAESASRLENLNAEDVGSENWNEQMKTSALSYVPKENWKRNLEHTK